MFDRYMTKEPRLLVMKVSTSFFRQNYLKGNEHKIIIDSKRKTLIIAYMSAPNTVSHISANILARQQILTMKFKEKITPHFGANVVYIGIQCPWDLNLSKIFNCNLIILSITAALCNHSSIILCSHIFLLKILKIL